jgi:hypothetical protein
MINRFKKVCKYQFIEENNKNNRFLRSKIWFKFFGFLQIQVPDYWDQVEVPDLQGLVVVADSDHSFN